MLYLLTGASQGIGLGYCEELLKTSSDDTHVIAAVRNPSNATELKQLADQYKGRLDIVQMDVTKPESVKSAFETISKMEVAKDGLDVLINNAGVTTRGTAAATEIPLEDVRKDYETNVFGTIDVTLTALPLLRKGKGKKIVTVGSLAGTFAHFMAETPMAAAYCSTKAAIHMWTLKLARELGEGWTVVSISPGYVMTRMNPGLTPETGGITLEEAKTKGVAVIKRLGPQDSCKLWDYTGETAPW